MLRLFSYLLVQGFKIAQGASGGRISPVGEKVNVQFCDILFSCILHDVKQMLLVRMDAFILHKTYYMQRRIIYLSTTVRSVGKMQPPSCEAGCCRRWRSVCRQNPLW